MNTSEAFWSGTKTSMADLAKAELDRREIEERAERLTDIALAGKSAPKRTKK